MKTKFPQVNKQQRNAARDEQYNGDAKTLPQAPATAATTTLVYTTI